MLNWIPWAALAALVPACDSAVRVLLVRCAKDFREPADTHGIADWVVLIPSRAEGAHLERTLASIRDASPAAKVRVLVVLDGEDPVARELAVAYGAQPLLKEPAGPSKAAAMRWAVAHAAATVAPAEAILVLDVGSSIGSGFFDSFRWPGDADAVQCFLSGTGPLLASAIADSERFAQNVEDKGRQRLGWNVRLRGTGSVFRARVFMEIVSELVTHVEDLEASLLLGSRGYRTAMAAGAAVVFDEKPGDLGSAALQRARWLAGTAMFLVRRSGSFARLCARRPAEGLAFLANCLGRPLSLTVALRIVVLLVLVARWRERPVLYAAAAGAIAASLLSDYVCLRGMTIGRGSAARLASAWFLAMPMLPRAVSRWLRAKR